MLHKAPPQCLTVRQQTVVRVRERKQREEGEGLAATGAATTTNANPVVMLIVRLLATASVADDRIAFTSRASPQNDLVAVSCPVVFNLVQRDGKWDKQNRSSWGSATALTAKIAAGSGAPPPTQKIQLKENNPSHLQLLGV
ncbi:MAG TPA: hypothetical protein VIX37_15815 [Candidatus Sulfotelmatobacter sp.]